MSTPRPTRRTETGRVTWRRVLRAVSPLLAALTVMLGLSAARDAWGLRGSGTHWLLLEHPFRVEVANRSELPVHVGVRAEGRLLREVFLTGRRRDYLDVSAEPGTHLQVHVRPLDVSGPDARQHEVVWDPVERGSLIAVIGADGTVTERRFSDEPHHVAADHGLLDLTNEYDLPVRVGHLMEPGNGGLYMPDERDRERMSWRGPGVSAYIGGRSWPLGSVARLAFTVPAVLPSARVLDVEVAAEDELEVELAADGSVGVYPMTVGRRLVRFAGF